MSLCSCAKMPSAGVLHSMQPIWYINSKVLAALNTPDATDLTTAVVVVSLIINGSAVNFMIPIICFI